MEYFEFSDCGPKLKQTLLEQFKNEETAALEVRKSIESRPAKDGTAQMQNIVATEAHLYVNAAAASRTERGKALLALVGDVLLGRWGKDDAILIPAVLTRWVSLMDEISTTA